MPRIFKDPQSPIVVFLGPSLDTDLAKNTLTADYYEPAQMGDIYRLLATGVKTIVLIDGLFHTTAAVWQRELLAALAIGIRVVGAASMGALRAVELHPYGMVGMGTIFQWYHQGIIDGDDEVALLHADADQGFQAISVPLVNIRYNLERAVAQTGLTVAESVALLAEARNVWFGDRHYQQLLKGEAARNLSPQVRLQLQQFFYDQTIDLKKQDTLLTLKALAAEETVLTLSPRPALEESRFYQGRALLERGFRHASGYLIRGKQVIQAAQQDKPQCLKRTREAASRFYLLRWAKSHEVSCPPEQKEFFWRQWQARHGAVELEHWLRNNGLTKPELDDLIGKQALQRYLIGKGPAFFGLDNRRFAGLPELWLKRASVSEREALLEQAAELCFLADWARKQGIGCGKERSEWVEQRLITEFGAETLEQWKIENDFTAESWNELNGDLACVSLLLERQPLHFGYTSWDSSAALLRELQYHGEAAEIVARMVLPHG